MAHTHTPHHTLLVLLVCRQGTQRMPFRRQHSLSAPAFPSVDQSRKRLPRSCSSSIRTIRSMWTPRTSTCKTRPDCCCSSSSRRRHSGGQVRARACRRRCCWMVARQSSSCSCCSKSSTRCAAATCSLLSCSMAAAADRTAPASVSHLCHTLPTAVLRAGAGLHNIPRQQLAGGAAVAGSRSTPAVSPGLPAAGAAGK